MRVVIVGGGEVGYHLAQRLSEDAQDVVLIDSDPERAEHASEQLDVLTVVGNGASVPVLQKAGIKGARMLLSVTSRDEVNLIACLAASRMGVPYTVARISNPEYYTPGSVLSREQLGIDRMINPEREAARDTFRLIERVAATDVVEFAGGRIQLLGLRVKEGSSVAGKSLKQLGHELGDHRYVIMAIVRDGQTIIPRGEARIEAGDQVYMLSPADQVRRIPPLAGYESRPLKRAMIAGGSLEGEYLAEILEKNGVACTMIDRDRRRCVELAEALPKALVLHGDATDLELLEMEGVAGIDAFVAATGDDQTNLLSSLLAKNAQAQRVVALIEKFEYLPLVPKVGLDAAVSPRMSAVNAILRYIRRGRVLKLATLTGTDAEAMELRLTPASGVVGRSIREIHFPRGVIVGAILRGEEITVPGGDDRFRSGDDVIVFGLPEPLAEAEKLFS